MPADTSVQATVSTPGVAEQTGGGSLLVLTKAEVDEVVAIAEKVVRSVMDDLVQPGERI